MRAASGFATSLSALALILGLAGCATGPEHRRFIPSVSASTAARSPNYDWRRPQFVVLHYTETPTDAGAIAALTAKPRQVSAHYLILRTGEILQLVDERYRAWHAGASYWSGLTDLNAASLGIEIVNSGNEPFNAAQTDALLALLRDIKARHRIPTANFVGHSDIAPGRKIDPGRFFPWPLLAQQGFGLWCDDARAETPGADLRTLLDAIGYDTSEMPRALNAFALHYGPLLERNDPTAVAQCLLAQKRRRAE